MRMGCDVVMRATANGFAVEARGDVVNPDRLWAGVRVFSTLEAAMAFLAEHFDARRGEVSAGSQELMSGLVDPMWRTR